MSIFKAGARALGAAAKASAGVPTLYSRGSMSVNADAVPGHSTFDVQTGDGQFVERVNTRDFIYTGEDLHGFGEPQPGDQITEFGECGETVGVYQAMPIGQEACFRYSDDFRQRVRVHTKKVA